MGKRPGGGEGSEHARKKSKGKYFSHAKKSWHGSGVPTGTSGFMVTCWGGKEMTSIREAISVLEEEWELLQGPSTRAAGGDDDEDATAEREEEESDEEGSDGEDKEEGSDGPGTSTPQNEEASWKPESGGGGGDGDIDKLLESEFGQLRDRKQAQFMGLDTGCKGIVYIRMARPKKGEEAKQPGPCELALSVLRKAAKTKVTKTRYCMRLLPAEVTTYASEDEIVKGIKPLLDVHFPPGEDQAPVKYSVIFEARANSTLDRMTVINKIAQLVPKPHSVDLSHPQKCIMVQILKSTCLLSVLSEFKELGKYNLQQLTMPDDKKAAAAGKKGPMGKGGAAAGPEKVGSNSAAKAEATQQQEEVERGPAVAVESAGHGDGAPKETTDDDRQEKGEEDRVKADAGGVDGSA